MLRRVVIGSAIAATSWYAYYRVTRWRETWGREPGEAALPLAGDDLLPAADVSDTRGITIDAPPEAVWPWLVQMGYGRGGWYSYDQLDMKGHSADEVRHEWQSLAVGDTVPTDPGGGFLVRVLEAGSALVLYADGELMASQRGSRGASVPVGSDAPGLAASGRFLDAAVAPDFAASWAFVLRPLPDGRTRLLERFRFASDGETPASRILGPLLGFGVFVMVHRQLLGIRERAERPARQGTVPAAADIAPSSPGDPQSAGEPVPA
jgi:hypothetical protein